MLVFFGLPPETPAICLATMGQSIKDKKKEKKKESEKFDSNIDAEGDNSSSASSSRKSSTGARPLTVTNQNQSGSGPPLPSTLPPEKPPLPQTPHPHDAQPNSSNMSDVAKLCEVMLKGLDTVSNKITSKLNDVSTNFKQSISDLNEKIDANKAGESDRESDNASSVWSRSVYSSDDDDRNPSKRRRIDDSSSEVSTKKGDAYFKNLNKPKVEEKVGAKVNDDLAEAVDRHFRKPISELEFKEYKGKYVRPENVHWIQSPEIPLNIWKRLPQDFKNADKPIHFVQEQLSPVLSSMVYAIEKLGEGDLEGGRDILSDTLAMFGFVFRTNMTEKRRSALKPKLPDDFRLLVSDKCEPSPSNLLGDISENSKKVSETEKITAQMDRQSKPNNQNKNFNKSGKYQSSSNNNNNNNSNKSGYTGKRNYTNKKDYKKDDQKDKYKQNKNFHHGNNRK